jgi:hypothetical protein
MSADNMYINISRFHGHTPKVSALGQGMCQNSAIVAFGIFRRISCGNSAKWKSWIRITGLSVLDSAATTSANFSFTSP